MWEKGQSGNPAGRKPEKLIRDAIIQTLKETETVNGKQVKKLRLLAEALFKEAKKGNVAAIKEIADRCDGKSVQPHAGSDGESPIQIEAIEWRIVKVDPALPEQKLVEADDSGS